MNKQELEEEFSRLEKLYNIKNDSHAKRFAHGGNESSYQDSCNQLKEIRSQLVEVGEKLGISFPVQL